MDIASLHEDLVGYWICGNSDQGQDSNREMATLGAVFGLSLALTVLNTGKGLKIVPSTEPSFETFYESGTNLNISCSEEGLVYLDWHKDTSDLSSCSANVQPYCLPGGRYTYENGSFIMMLIDLKSDDCGQYICKTHKGSKSFDLHLVDRVNRMDVVENSDSINMTTDCVYPTYTVNVQWFYIPEGGSPVLYNKPSKRSEGKGDCVGTCLENKALKVSSRLELPDEVKNPIKVKMMVYVEQGGLIQKQISANEYIIEGCLPPTKVGIIVALCLAVILIIVDILRYCRNYLLRRHQNEQANDKEAPLSPVHTDRLQGAEPTRRGQSQEREKHTKENKNAEKENSDARSTNVDTGRPEVIELTHTVHVQETEEQRHEVNHAKKKKADDFIVPIIVSGVISICCIILLVLKHETRIPDLNGNCQDFYITNMTSAVAVTFVIILICNHWKVLWEIVTLIRGMRRKMMLPKSMMLRKAIEGNAEDEAKGLLGTHSRPSTGHSTNIDTCELEVAKQSTKMGTHEQKEEGMKTKEKKPEDPYKQETKNCDLTVPCFPSRPNTVLTNIGETGKLICTLESEKYPAWQAPGGKIINYGEQKDLEEEFRKEINWDTDKKSLIISHVKMSDAGTYLCFSANGKVQSIDLFVMLPTEKIEVSVNKTVHLDPGKDIRKVRPVWRRPTPFVAELYNEVLDDRIERGSDGKSIYIKKCNVEDRGLYEVIGNNIIKYFDLSITDNEQIEQTYTVAEGCHIRLDSSSKENYPSWECVGANIFNYGGEETLKLIRSENSTKKLSRFSWSVDKKSLLIEGILPEDTGTYTCRHASGFVESVTVIVRGEPKQTSIKSSTIELKTMKKEKKVVIPHNTGYEFPSLRYVRNTDGIDEEVFVSQNYKSRIKPSKKKANSIGYIPKSEMENVKDNLIECSVYGQSIRVFKINERPISECADSP